MLTPEKIAELQKKAREQPIEQQEWLYSMLQLAEKHDMAEPGTSEKFKPQPPEGQTKQTLPRVTIKPSEDARHPTLEARIERDWKQWRPSYYRMLKKEGTLQRDIKQTALWCVETLHQCENRGLNPDQGRELIRELILP